MAKRTPNLCIGDTYGSWLLLEEVQRTKETFYVCKCKCGHITEVSKSNLALGKSKSCNKGGCKATVRIHGMSGSHLHSVWCGIKSRLNNPTGNNKCYEGISLFPEWQEFNNFSKWALENGYEKGLSIDRIDSSKDYSPSNCRWTDTVTQSQNRRKHSIKESSLPKGVYRRKPRNGKVLYKGTGKAPFYWIVIYKGKRHQCSGFSSPEEAYEDRCKFIKENYSGLVYHD